MAKALALVLTGLLCTAAGPSAAPYRLLATLTGPAGSYDYASFDLQTNRVFVGREFGVMVANPVTGVMKTLLRRRGVAAVLPITGTRLMLSTNGDENSATLFNRDTGRVAADIRTGEEPDAAYYDAASKKAFVMNAGSKAISVIDVPLRKLVGTIPVSATPEGAVSDGRGRLFVNLEERNEIAVLDIARLRVRGHYRLPGCKEPTAMAFDPRTSTLISACRNAIVRLIDSRTGADRGSMATGARSDGAIFDGSRRIGFIPALDGSLTVFRLDRAAKATVIQTLRTREGARTATYDPVRDRVYLPQATVERDPQGDYVRAKADFHLIVVAR